MRKTTLRIDERAHTSRSVGEAESSFQWQDALREVDFRTLPLRLLAWEPLSEVVILGIGILEHVHFPIEPFEVWSSQLMHGLWRAGQPRSFSVRTWLDSPLRSNSVLLAYPRLTPTTWHRRGHDSRYT
jgi:hypothetical protein